MELQAKKMHWYDPIFRFLQGSVIGAAGILPGLSGGVLSVIFGVYQPMMELLAHPFRTWKKHLNWVIPFAIGFVAGFFGIARVLEVLFTKNEGFVVCAFIGLIIGTFPDLFREGGKEGWSRAGKYTFGIVGVLLFALFFGLNLLKVKLQINIAWSFLCGVLWGISIIVPGMSSSSILMNIGLYQPMNEGISRFDLSVLIPMGIGIMAVVLIFAHIVNFLFERHYNIAFAVVLAAVVSSTVAIVPYRFESFLQFVFSFAFVIFGAVSAYLISRASTALASRQEQKQQQ